MPGRSVWGMKEFCAALLSVPLCWGVLCEKSLAEEPDSITLIRMGGRRPYFISLKITLDRHPIGISRSDQMEGLFEILDSDSSKDLDEKELQELTRRGVPSFTPTGGSNWWKKGDRSPGDGKISGEDFRSLEETILGSPVQFQFLPPRQSQVFDLMGKLDRNQDGKVSFEEILEGSQTLTKFDLNEDGSVAVEELVPPGTTPEMLNPSTSVNRIWILITNKNLKETAERLVQEFDHLPDGAQDQQLSAVELGISEQRLSEFDGDENHLLNVSEVEKLLAAPPIDLEGKLQIRSNSFRRPKLEMEALNPEIKLTASENGSSTPLDGIQVGWSSRGTTITSDDARRFYRQRFFQADADKNQYLDPQEFGVLAIPGTPFTIVDQNQDGKLFADELLSYLRLQIVLTQGRVVLICANETRSLLELLDKDSDRRLSAREFHEGNQNLGSIDVNQDRAISQSELAEEQSILVEYNRSALLEFASRSSNAQGMRSVTRQVLSGPEWFQKMDRNRDGFLTRREFLGPLDVFEKMDGNKDGAIDEQEALNGG